MEPSIRFVCPACQREFPEPLGDLGPGRVRRCTCGGTPRITEESKAELRRSLEAFFQA